MATARVKAKPQIPRFGPELLDAVGEVGEPNELRFKLSRVKLADGTYHKLTKPVTVKVKWDPAVCYYIAIDTKFLGAGEGDTAQEALQNYLEDWSVRLRRLEEDEAILGRGLLEELNNRRKLLGLTVSHAP